MSCLFLVHHGEAVDPEIDPQRPLSGRGQASAQRLAQMAGSRGVKPDVIWHSGKVRARQTAEAFWRECNPLAEFAAVRGLQPTDPPEWVGDRLAGDERTIMLVGHFPNLKRVLDLLVRGSPGEFPQHGMVALERSEGSWELLWRFSEPR